MPDPDLPRVAIPLRAEFFSEHPPETLPRPAKDLLLHAVAVGDVVWSEWGLSTPGAAQAVLDVTGL